MRPPCSVSHDHLHRRAIDVLTEDVCGAEAPVERMEERHQHHFATCQQDYPARRMVLPCCTNQTCDRGPSLRPWSQTPPMTSGHLNIGCRDQDSSRLIPWKQTTYDYAPLSIAPIVRLPVLHTASDHNAGKERNVGASVFA